MIDLTLDSDESDEEEASTSGIEKTFSSDRCVCVCVCAFVCVHACVLYVSIYYATVFVYLWGHLR